MFMSVANESSRESSAEFPSYGRASFSIPHIMCYLFQPYYFVSSMLRGMIAETVCNDPEESRNLFFGICMYIHYLFRRKVV